MRALSLTKGMTSPDGRGTLSPLYRPVGGWWEFTLWNNITPPKNLLTGFLYLHSREQKVCLWPLSSWFGKHARVKKRSSTESHKWPPHTSGRVSQSFRNLNRMKRRKKSTGLAMHTYGHPAGPDGQLTKKGLLILEEWTFKGIPLSPVQL